MSFLDRWDVSTELSFLDHSYDVQYSLRYNLRAAHLALHSPITFPGSRILQGVGQAVLEFLVGCVLFEVDFGSVSPTYVIPQRINCRYIFHA